MVFDVEVLCYEIKPKVGDENAQQVSLTTLQKKAQVISLHVPHTEQTFQMINTDFICNFEQPFWLLNTARGSCVVTEDLVAALKSKIILGAGLDVLEYEKSSFETLFSNETSAALEYLLKSDAVIVTPHVAGWTVESHQKLAQTIVDKIVNYFH